jgi:hypothetical protein
MTPSLTIRKAVGISLGLSAFFLFSGLLAVPVAHAGVPGNWSGSTTAQSSACPADTETVNWSISYSSVSHEFTYRWSTSVSWFQLCTNSGCVAYIEPFTETTSQPDSGSGVSTLAPDFTVAPISTATYVGACYPPGLGSVTATIQAVATIMT